MAKQNINITFILIIFLIAAIGVSLLYLIKTPHSQDKAETVQITTPKQTVPQGNEDEIS